MRGNRASELTVGLWTPPSAWWRRALWCSSRRPLHFASPSLRSNAPPTSRPQNAASKGWSDDPSFWEEHREIRQSEKRLKGIFPVFWHRAQGTSSILYQTLIVSRIWQQFIEVNLSVRRTFLEVKLCQTVVLVSVNSKRKQLLSVATKPHIK